MNKLKIVFLFVVTFLLSMVPISLSGEAGQELVRDIVVTFLPLILGLLLAAVGIFLGSLGNLYSILVTANVETGERKRAVERIGKVVNEVKENTIFSLVSLSVILSIRFMKAIDIPRLAWPFAVRFLSKQVIYDTLTITLCALIMLAIYDCVAAMFTINGLYESLICEENTGKKGRPTPKEEDA